MMKAEAEKERVEEDEVRKIFAEKEGALGWIVFNQPEKRNAMSLEMWEGLPGLMQAHEADPEVRVICLRGAGDKAFISGADISQFEKLRSDMAQSQAYNAATERATNALKNSSKPTVAVIQGFCFGGGMGVASSCDLRVAAADALFRIPAARLGLSYGFAGIQHLISLVGAAHAREIFLTASVYPADEMLRMGLLNRVYPAGELDEQARAYAAVIADNAPLTMASIKISIEEAVKDADNRNMARVAEAAKRCFDSDDYQEGRRAFMEKRQPKFSGT